MQLYRYEDWQAGPIITLRIFFVIKETACGYWFRDEVSIKKRWVSKTTKKRFCYPTRTEAWVSFLARKKRQRLYLKAQLEHCEKILEKLDENNPPPGDNIIWIERKDFFI